MSGLGFIYLAAITLTIVLFFSYILKVKGPWGGFWTFFLITFLAVLAGSFWLQPAGPYYRDIYFLPPIGLGLLIAILLAAASPGRFRRGDRGKTEGIPQAPPGAMELGAFFWFLLIFMLILIITGYVFGGYFIHHGI